MMRLNLGLVLLMAGAAACQSGRRSEISIEEVAPIAHGCDEDENCGPGSHCASGTCVGRGHVQGRIFWNGTQIQGPLFVGLFPSEVLDREDFDPKLAVAGATYAAPSDPQPFQLDSVPTGSRVLIAYTLFPAEPAASRIGFGSMPVDILEAGSVVIDGQTVSAIDIFITGATGLAD